MCGHKHTVLKFLKVLLPAFHIIGRSVVRQPNRLSDEEPLRPNVILKITNCKSHLTNKPPIHHLNIQRKPVINPARNDDHISRHHFDSDPLIVSVSNVEISRSFDDEADLFVRVQVLLEEALQFLFVVGKALFRASYFVFVGVASLFFDAIEHTVGLVRLRVQLESN